MRYILLISLFIFSLYANSLESISFNNAVQKAKEDNKIIMVVYEQEKCDASKKMNEETFSNEDIVSLIEENFHYVFINTSYNKTLRGLPMKGTPTIYFLNKNKKLLKKTIGAIKVKVFKNILVDIVFKKNNPKKTKKKIAENKPEKVENKPEKIEEKPEKTEDI